MPTKRKPYNKSKRMKIAATKSPVAKVQSGSIEAESRAVAMPKGNVTQSVPPTTHISTSPVQQAGFEAGSEALLSLIRSNFDALRASVKSASARHDRGSDSQAGLDLTTALDRLEVGYRKLLRR